MRKPPQLARAWGNDWVQTLREPTPWIWDGFIAEDAITLLSAPEKTGKTTLLSLLLDRRREGGMLLGREVRPGRTIVCSEESRALWALRQPPLDFGSRLEFHVPCMSKSRPTRGNWKRYIDHLLSLGDTYFDLLVIDTAMSFLPARENNPRALLSALSELRVVSNGPAGILILHQARAVRNRSGTRGALAAFADILIDVQIPGGDRLTRRRLITGVGRYPGTCQRVTATLNVEGTHYEISDDNLTESTSAPSLDTVRHILSTSPEPLTRQEILTRWPESEPPPRADSLWRTLSRSCEDGTLVRSGAGNKGEAFRYAVTQH